MAGIASSSNLPSFWSRPAQNPSGIAPQYNLGNIALSYNNTLTQLSENFFQNASTLIQNYAFQNYPGYISNIANQANGELASLNSSLSTVYSELNKTNFFLTTGLYANASKSLSVGCSTLNIANSTFNNFRGPITNSFSQAGVQVSLYSVGVSELQSAISSYSLDCSLYAAQMSQTSTDLAIFSPQTSVTTGGLVQLSGSLTKSGAGGVPNQNISFFANNTQFGRVKTNSAGSFQVSLHIPYLYGNNVSIWATVESNATAQIFNAVSKKLNLTLIYVQTVIALGDPPSVYPDHDFTIHGQLETKSGSPLPNATIALISFNVTIPFRTDSSGSFTETLTVPSNATDGLHYINATFPSSGVLGPSYNLTSINVVRLPLSLSAKPSSSLAFSGLSTTIGGTARANGSALSNTVVSVSTPWGTYNSTSNLNGNYAVELPVPISEFGTGSPITITAFPSQPYIHTATTTRTLSTVNPIEVIVPILLMGFGIYQARNLDLFPQIRKKKEETERKRWNNLSETSPPTSSLRSQILVGRPKKLVELYQEALSLAARKFSLEFPKSMTIRESIDLVSTKDKESARSFGSVALAAENYLYGTRDSQSEVQSEEKRAEEALSDLRRIWS